MARGHGALFPPGRVCARALRGLWDGGGGVPALLPAAAGPRGRSAGGGSAGGPGPGAGPHGAGPERHGAAWAAGSPLRPALHVRIPAAGAPGLPGGPGAAARPEAAPPAATVAVGACRVPGAARLE